MSALGFLYLYTCVFQGPGFSRQRFAVEVPLLVAALYAFGRHPRRASTWTALAACAVAPAELVQAQVIPAKVLALVVAAGGAGWLAARRARWLSLHRRGYLGEHHQLPQSLPTPVATASVTRRHRSSPTTYSARRGRAET